MTKPKTARRKPEKPPVRKRKKPVERDGLMERARACRGVVDSDMLGPGGEMTAFLALFHPDMDEHRHRALMQDARERGRRRQAMGYAY